MAENETLASQPVAEEESPKKSHRGRNIFLYILVGVLVVAVGVVIGFFSGQAAFNPSVDYASYNIYDLDDDYEALYNNYKANPDISAYNPYQIADIALYQYEQEENHYSEVYGDVDAAMNQTTHGIYIKNGDNLFAETISTSSLSAVETAVRQYEDYANGSVVEYSGKPTSSYAASFNETGTTYTEDEFIDHFGRSLTRATAHIISSQTVTSSKLTEIEDGYSVEVHLDPIKGVVRYVRQMAVYGDLSNLPVFSDVYVTFDLDNDLNLVYAEYHEEYRVKIVGINFNCTGVTREYFHSGEFYEIPDMDTNVTYNY